MFQSRPRDAMESERDTAAFRSVAAAIDRCCFTPQSTTASISFQSSYYPHLQSWEFTPLKEPLGSKDPMASADEAIHCCRASDIFAGSQLSSNPAPSPLPPTGGGAGASSEAASGGRSEAVPTINHNDVILLVLVEVRKGFQGTNNTANAAAATYDIPVRCLIVVDKIACAAARGASAVLKKAATVAAAASSSSTSAAPQAADVDAATAVLLLAGPANYTLWNTRRRLMNAAFDAAASTVAGGKLDGPIGDRSTPPTSGANADVTTTTTIVTSMNAMIHQWCQIVAKELRLDSLILARLPKCPEAWSYRGWVIRTFFERLAGLTTATTAAIPGVSDVGAVFLAAGVPSLVQFESIEVVADGARAHHRNYPAWMHLRNVWNAVTDAVTNLIATSKANDEATTPPPAPAADTSKGGGSACELGAKLASVWAATELYIRTQWLATRPFDTSAAAALAFHIQHGAQHSSWLFSADKPVSPMSSDLPFVAALRAALALNQRQIRQVLRPGATPSSTSAAASASAGPSSVLQLPISAGEGLWAARRIYLSAILDCVTNVVGSSSRPGTSSHSSPSIAAIQGVIGKHDTTAGSASGSRASCCTATCSTVGLSDAIAVVLGQWSLSDELNFVSACLSYHEALFSRDDEAVTVAVAAGMAPEAVVAVRDWAPIHMCQYELWLLRLVQSKGIAW
jgi:hypothetical protein